MRRRRMNPEAAFPKVPGSFHLAMEQTLWEIVKEAAPAQRPALGRRRRVAAMVLAASLALCAAAGAVGARFGLFDFLRERDGEEAVQPGAQALLHQDLAAVSLEHVDVRITEAVYDGSDLRVVYSVRLRDAKEALEERELYDGEGAFLQAALADGVNLGGADWFTLDGVEHTMTGGSTAERRAGGEPGEMLVYVQIKLSSEDIHPQGDTATFGLALLTGRPRTEQTLTFTVPAKELPGVREAQPGQVYAFGITQVTVLDARLGPVRATASLRLDFAREVGAVDAMNQALNWADAQLVDAQGQPVSEGIQSQQSELPGEADTQRHLRIDLEFTPPAQYPERVYLAPFSFNGQDEYLADMTQAIELTKEENEP